MSDEWNYGGFMVRKCTRQKVKARHKGRIKGHRCAQRPVKSKSTVVVTRKKEMSTFRDANPLTGPAPL